ncbi:phosphotransferase [Paenibacillus sp. VMFN-D1]|uniref:phosphotransferase n=1 Tax=Paenibacillus sp. VMFN-D1 TaxID=2135608 RepID=UPI001C6E1D9F|nr:phosphotransferase [Paenibacillus sp. VMFN-D1]
MEPIEERIRKLLAEIREQVGYDRAEPLEKGFSDARKFVLYQADTPVYLLRIHEGSMYFRQRMEFELLRKHEANQVHCSKPLVAELVGHLDLCYLLLSYIPGVSGDEVLPGLAPEAQLQQGTAAGKELRKIHQVTPEVPPYTLGGAACRKIQAEKGEGSGIGPSLLSAERFGEIHRRQPGLA